MAMATKWRWATGIASGVVILGVGGGTGLWQYHKQPNSCGVCHIMDSYVETWNGSEFLAKAHAEAGVTCLECHEATLEQQLHEVDVFLKKEYEDPLERRKFDMDFCFRCHEHETYEQVAALTSDLEDKVGANPHDNHNGELECRVCHRVHQESIDYCAGCHTWGWDVP